MRIGTQKALRASTETEAIERGLDLVISEFERDRMAAEANEREFDEQLILRTRYLAPVNQNTLPSWKYNLRWPESP